MSEIAVKWNGMSSVGSEFVGIKKTIGNLSSRVDRINKSMPYVIDSKALYSIQRSLNNIVSELNRCGRSAGDMGNVLKNVSELYKNTEQGLSDIEGHSKRKPHDILPRPHSKLITVGPSKRPSWCDYIINMFDKVISEFGIAGLFASSLIKILFNKSDTVYSRWKNRIDIGKNINKAFGNYAKEFWGGDRNIKKLFWDGTPYLKNLTDKGYKINTFGQRISAGWKKGWSDFTFKGAKTVGDKAKVITKWGEALLSLASNAISNREEMEKDGISVQRAVAETVVETGVDIVKGVAVTAAVGAAIGGAPAIVVGAVEAGVIWGADWISKKINGKSLTENISDGIINHVVDIPNRIRNKISAVKDGLAKIGSGFVKWRNARFAA